MTAAKKLQEYFENNYDKLTAYAKKLTKENNDFALDVLHLAYCQTQKLPKDLEIRFPGTYLHTAIHHVSQNFFNKERRDLLKAVKWELFVQNENQINLKNAEDILEEADQMDALAAFINSLPKKQAMVISSILKGQSSAELAEQTGIPYNTVKANKKHALDKAKGYLKKKGV